MYRTTYGYCLDVLAGRLANIARDDEIQGADGAIAIAEAFLSTPEIWPLSDELFEMLLGFAAVDLNHSGGAHMAVSIARYLEGTGICPIQCTHPPDDPSPVCARVRAGEETNAYEAGLQMDGTRDRAQWIDLRCKLTTAFRQAIADADAEDEGWSDAA